VAVEDLVASDARVAAEINRALLAHEIVRLQYYTASREELAERLVEPYLLFHSGNAWYLEAFCLRAQAQRTFRLDRIRDASSTGQSFSPRADVDLTLRKAGSLTPLDSPKWAVIRFPKGAARGLREQGVAVNEKEGCVQARIPYLDARWLVKEVLKHAGQAVLEEPRHLRVEVARLADDMLELYRPAKSGEPKGQS
jgi:proteasome accessory factor C